MNDRRARILRMVAESYIRTAHPVASARIAERLELSSATVRNEFGALEEEGYLQQPHTSAGRIPTSRGFRSYALGCLPPRRLPERQRSQLVRQLLATNGDGLFTLVARAAAELSGYAVVVRLPADDALHILEIHLSMLSAERLLAVVVLENGIVRQLSVDLAPPPADGVLDDAERNLRQLTLPLGEVPRALDAIAAHADEELARTLQAIAGAWPRLNPPRMFSEGLRQLLAEPESSDPEFIRLVVEQVERAEQPAAAWTTEAQPLGLDLDDAVARITSSFGLGVGMGSLTVLGPARMRYPAAMMVARGVSEALSLGLQRA
jgi:heat-inducible transcriptional repressor